MKGRTLEKTEINLKMVTKNNKNKYSWKNIFYIFFLMWIIDFTLIIILLNFRTGFYEDNFISAFLYSLGVLGYIINFILCISVILLLSFLVTKLIN